MSLNKQQPLVKKEDIPQKMSSVATFNTAFNTLLGSGPILLPSVFSQPGLGLALLFLGIIAFLSFICAQFVIETMSILNAIRKKEKENILETSVSSDQFELEDIEKIEKVVTHIPSDKQDQFMLEETIEYGSIAQELFGRQGQGFFAFVLSSYFIGTVSSKIIMIGSILSKAFAGVGLLENKNTWIISSFLASIVFSFGNVQNTKSLQLTIIVVRFLTIAALLIGSIQVGIVEGFHGLNGNMNDSYFDINNFTSYFNNIQFSLLMHHSIPSMFSHIQNQHEIKKVQLYAVGIGSLSLVLISLLGVSAFGQCLNTQKVQHCITSGLYLNGSSYFNSYFKGIANADWVFYISSFYVFLNIAAFPVVFITMRNNVMKFIYQSRVQINGSRITGQVVFYTIILTSPIITIALLTSNIQLVLDWVSGIFGSLIMTIGPSVFVIFSRRKAESLNIPHEKNILKAMFSHKYLPYFTLTLGSALLVFTVYNNFKKYL